MIMLFQVKLVLNIDTVQWAQSRTVWFWKKYVDKKLIKKATDSVTAKPI